MASESVTVGHGFCCCGLYGTYVERVQPHWWFCPHKEIYFDSNRVTDSLYVLRTQGMDSVCGCPRTCPGPTIQVARGPFLPDELHDIINLTDFNKFADEVDEALAETHWPTIPCEFTFCLAVFAFNYCANQRHERVQAILEANNERLVERGLYWEPLNFPGYLAQLKVNHHARQAYLAKHGLSYDRAPSPKHIHGITSIPNTDDDAKLARQLSDAYMADAANATATTTTTTVVMQQPRPLPEQPANNRHSTSSYYSTSTAATSVAPSHGGHHYSSNGAHNGHHHNGHREHRDHPRDHYHNHHHHSAAPTNGHGSSAYRYSADQPVSRQPYGGGLTYHNVSNYEGRTHEFKDDDADVRDSVRGSVAGSVDHNAPVRHVTRASSSNGVSPERISARYSRDNLDAQGNLLNREKSSRYDQVLEQQRAAEAHQNGQFTKKRSGEMAAASSSNGGIAGTYREVNPQEVEVSYEEHRRSPLTTPEGIPRGSNSGYTSHNNSNEKLHRVSSFNQPRTSADRM